MRVYIRTRQPEPGEEVTSLPVAISESDKKQLAAEVARSILRMNPLALMADVQVEVSAQVHVVDGPAKEEPRP